MDPTKSRGPSRRQPSEPQKTRIHVRRRTKGQIATKRQLGKREAYLMRQQRVAERAVRARPQPTYETALSAQLAPKLSDRDQAKIVEFPRPFRHPLPPDAIPLHKIRHVYVFPWRGAWSWFETDESGGTGEDGLTKQAAIEKALAYVFGCAATMEIVNSDPDHGDPFSGWA
jgi:hypothetical protein